MKVEYGTDGMATVHRDGQVLGGWDPAPGGNEWQITQQIFQQDGGVVYSSQWGGWVPHEHDPLQGCPQSGGNIDGSHFSVSNLRISGSVVHGPEPSRCSSPSPSPPSPSPAPAPTPAGQCQVSDCKNNDGTNLKSTAESASSADQCCDKCKSATGCVGWTWVKDNGECWLKSSVSAARDDDCGCCVTSGTYSAPAPVPSPAPTPVPMPSPVPTPTDCPGGSLANCIKGCPTDATVFQICVAECDKRCESATSCTGGDDGSSLETCVKGCPSDSYMDCVTCCSGKFPSMLML